MKKTLKILLIGLSSVIILTAVLIVGINLHMISFSDKYIMNDVKKINGQPKQAVIVFGAFVYDSGQPCPMLEDRLLAGIGAYEEGYAEKILLSGDHGTKGYDEVNSMKTFAFSEGVPQSDVFLDHAGFSTYESVIRAKEIFLIEDALLSTQEYHLIRAVYIARKAGIEAYGITADRRLYPRSEMARYIIREWMARVKDFFYVNIFKPEPTFLGDEIPISGDSQLSYDKPDDLN